MMSIVSLVVRLGLGALLLRSGAEKLRAWSWFFEDVVSKMGLFDRQAAALVAGIIPGIESAAGLFLIAGFLRRGAAVVALALFVAFTGVSIYLILEDIPLKCGCFGRDSDWPVDWAHVVLDLGFAAAAWFVIVTPRSAWALDTRIFGDARERPAGEATG